MSAPQSAKICVICGLLLTLGLRVAAAAPEQLHRDTVTHALIESALDLKSVTLTLGNATISDASGIRTISLGATNGVKFGATGDRIGFLGAAAISRPSGDVPTALVNLGLISSPTIAESDITALVTDLAARQPLDADLTAIAALGTTAYGRGALALANGSAFITYFGKTTLAGYAITDAQPLDADLTAIAALHTNAYGIGTLSLTDGSSFITYLGKTTLAGYAITDAQPLDPDLTAIAALTTTPYGRGALALADNNAFITYLGKNTLAGYGIVDAQPLDSDLTAIATNGTTAYGRGLIKLADGPSAITYLGQSTIAGYGITDFNSLGDARWSALAHVHTFASLTFKPTTIAGYGITDLIGYTNITQSWTAQNFSSETTGSITVNSLGTPGAPTVTHTGATGATTWSYRIVAKLADGTGTPGGATGSTTTGDDVLDNTNFNNLSWTAVTGAISYDVYRTVVGVSPSTTGKITNLATTSYSDKGAAGDGSIVPASNTTGAIQWVADNTSDIGAAASGRPRDVNAGRNVNAPGAVFGSATISGGTLTGITSFAGGSMALTGNETVGGTLAVTGATNGSSLALSGNETVGGSLAVTGATTGSTAAYTSTLRGKVQDIGGAVYHVKAFGLAGDGSTDDTAALQTLSNTVVSAGGGTIVFDSGTFILHGTVALSSANKVNFQGAGQNQTIIKSTMPVGTPTFGNPTMFNFATCTYVSMSGITFDNNNIVTTADETSLVALGACSNVKFRNCDFINFKKWCLAMNNTTNFVISDCYFNRTTIENTYQNLAIAILSSSIRSGPGWITRNNLAGAGIQLDADNINISDNTITGFGYGAGVVVNDGSLITLIKGNHLSGGSGFDGTSYVSGIEAYANSTVVTGNVVHNNDGVGIAFGGQYSIITGNVVYDNGSAANPSIGIANNYQGPTQNGSFSTISGNISREIVGTHQQYGYADIGTGNISTSIRFSGNDFSGNSIAPYLKAAGSTNYVVVMDTIQASATWNPGTIVAGATTNITLTVTGANPGDFSQASLSTMPNLGLQITSYVYSGGNQVNVQLSNPTASSAAVPSGGTLYVSVTAKRPF